MAQQPLGPPPRVETGTVFDRWMNNLWNRISVTGQILWAQIDFALSNLTDIATRNHADLQNINTASYTHLSATNHTDLTDGGATTLHKHDHGGLDGLADDDHTQYLLAAGTRGLSADWDAGAYKIKAKKVEITDYFISTAPVTETGDFSVADTENWLINNKSGSACTVTLPSAASYTGRCITIKTIQAQQVNSASSNVVPLAGGAAGTAILTATAGKWAMLVSDGTNWEIMAGN